METGALLILILLSLLHSGHTEDFYGHSVSFMPLQRRLNGTIPLTVVGRSSCSSKVSYLCQSGGCTGLTEGKAVETDTDSTGQNRWCQTEAQTTATVPANTNAVSLNASGCCWVSNADSIKDWSAQARLDLGYRSDTHSINNCPVTSTVANIRVPQNCFTTVRLLAHDPDGDNVKCRFISNPTANIVLDQNKCSLTKSADLSVGVHVFEVMLEDFPTKDINLTYPDGTKVLLNASNPNLQPLCGLKLLFTLQVLANLPSCEVGYVLPMFLSRTPSQEALVYASVGQTTHITAEAQAYHSSIKDFQISGPHNMTKAFQDSTNGKANVTLSWTPIHDDLYRHVPVCFTAETDEAQSEMRCVIVVVTKSTITQGKADVMCQANKMAVTLEKASMPGIDVNYLMLLDKSCSLTSNSSHIIGTISFSACGTEVEDKGDFIVFSNEIDSFELPTEIITRRRKVKIGFSCQFPKIISISTYFNLHKSDYIFTESTFGSFGYTFEIYKDSNFTNKVQPNDYPVQVELFKMIYMGIQAQSDLQAVTLFVESCKATPDDNPDNRLFYDLIKNGCILDETLVIKTQDTTFNFEVQAFKFNGNFDQVYITCSVILCEKGSAFSRCAQGCVENAGTAKRRRRRSLSKETVNHRITQGPLVFVGGALDTNDDEEDFEAAVANQDVDGTTAVVMKDLNQERANTQRPVSTPRPTRLVRLRTEDDDNDDDDDLREIREVLSLNLSTIILGTAFVLSLITMVILVCYFTKKRQAEDRKHLLDSD